MLRCILSEICCTKKFHISNLHSSFLKSFPLCTPLYRLEVLKMTAGTGILSSTMSALSFTKQNFAVFKNHYSYSDFWFLFFHKIKIRTTSVARILGCVSVRKLK